MSLEKRTGIKGKKVLTNGPKRQTVVVGGGFGGFAFYLLLSFILAFFTYGLDWTKGLGFVGWTFVTIFILLLCLIPFVGFILYVLGLVFWTLPIMTFFTIIPTWLTTLTLIVFSVIGLVITIATTWYSIQFYREWQAGFSPS